MGHSTAAITISAERAEQLLAAHTAGRSTHSRWLGMPANAPLHDVLLTEAINVWRDEEANRWDSAREGVVTELPIAPKALAHSRYDYEDAPHVNSESSIIVPVAADADVVTRTRAIKVPVTAEVLAGMHARGGATWAFQPLVRKALGAEGKDISAMEVVKLPARLAPKAVTTEGKLTTVYQVMAGGDRSVGQVLAERASLAEARSAALEMMEQKSSITGLVVRAIQRRVTDDGAANANLLVISRPAPKNATAEVKVTLQTVKPGAKPVAYVVAFDYHH